MAFVVDKSLDLLLAQVNAAAPNRRKDSDGSIGDADHQTRESAHNPEDSDDADAPGNPDDQVDARDFTHDPANNADMAVMTEALRKSRDKRLKLVIFNRRQFSNYWRDGIPPYTWRPYTGSNPHDKHAHVEVNDVYHDQTSPPWQIGIDMSEWASQVIESWSRGVDKTPAGKTVEPVKWRVRDEAWQRATTAAVSALGDRLAVLEQRPPVQPAPIDPAALKAVLLDPQVLAAIAKAVADEDHARSAG